MSIDSSSRQPSHVLYRWGSFFVSRPQSFAAIDPSQARHPNACLALSDFAQPMRLTAEYPYAPLTPRTLDDMDDPILMPLSLLSLTAVGPHGRMHLAEDIIVQWIDLEFRLIAIRDVLLRDVDQGVLPLGYRSCAVPTSYGYRKLYSTRKSVWRRAAQSRDAFAVLIAECHFLALMNRKLLDPSGRVHVSSLDVLLTSVGTFLHDVWLTTFVNLFDKPVAGFVASVADVEASFWLARLPKATPVYICWGDSKEAAASVKRAERSPFLAALTRPSLQDIARCEDASAARDRVAPGPPRCQSNSETYDSFMRRRRNWYTASAAVVLPAHGHVGVVQAFEWIKDSRGLMRREPVPPPFFHKAMAHYLEGEKIYDASRSEWDLCWAEYQKDVPLFNQSPDDEVTGETGLKDAMLPDAQVLHAADEREASKAICLQNALERLSDNMAVAFGARYGYFTDGSSVVIDDDRRPTRKTIAWLMGEGLQCMRTLCCLVPEDVSLLRAGFRVLLCAADGDEIPTFAPSVIDIFHDSAWSVWIRDSSEAFRVCVARDETSVPVYVFKFASNPSATHWIATYDAAVALMLQRIGSSCTDSKALFRLATELGCSMLVLHGAADSKDGDASNGKETKHPAYMTGSRTGERAVLGASTRDGLAVDDIRVVAGSSSSSRSPSTSGLRFDRGSETIDNDYYAACSAESKADATGLSQVRAPRDGACEAVELTAGSSSAVSKSQAATLSSASPLPVPPSSDYRASPGVVDAESRGEAGTADTPVAAVSASSEAGAPMKRQAAGASSNAPFSTDVAEYLRQRRLHFTLQRAAAMYRRGGILGRIARDLFFAQDFLSVEYAPASSGKPLIVCTFADGTTTADEDITTEDEDILIGTYFVANNPVDRFNTKKVTFWPTELMFNTKGPYCGVWTRDAEEWYLQRRDAL
ncbi:uncharacterized protein SCHCODRAFT_02495012 [Schizophyllum commune H4-8]|nr:uncharacterized protein SCHCODRAFT_02495012 [Schizophyllum commune H4-8]KAI5895196.1 hypothetical protein SCHCODRAFT_02495012 [Schizophyllum commune H4-8]